MGMLGIDWSQARESFALSGGNAQAIGRSSDSASLVAVVIAPSRPGHFRTEAVAVLSPYLATDLLLRALEAVRAVGDGAEAIPILAEVAYGLPSETAAAVAKRLLSAPKYYRLSRWAERAAPDELAAVLRTVRRGKSDRAKSNVLYHLTPHLPEWLTDCALALATSLGEASPRASASSMVIARMVALGKHEAAIKTAAVHGITADVASVISPNLDDVEVLGLVETIKSRPAGDCRPLHNLAALLHQLADRGHEDEVQRTIEEIPPLKAWIARLQQGRTPEKQWATLSDMLRDISTGFLDPRPLPVHETVDNGELKRRLLSDLSWLEDGLQRTARLSQLSGHLLPADIPPLQSAIQKLPARHRVHALVDLVRWLPSTIPQRAKLLQEAVKRVRAQKPPWRHFWIMELAPLIENREVIAEAVAAAVQTPDWRDADDFLAALSPLERYQAWLQALQHLRQRPRGEFFAQIWKFVRQASSREDKSSAASLFHAVTEVMRWWP